MVEISIYEFAQKCENENFATIENIIERLSYNQENGGEFHTAMIFAAKNSHLTQTEKKILIDRAINHKNSMIIAARYDWIEAATLLLEHGCSINNGNPLAHTATYHDCNRVSTYFLNNGADVTLGYCFALANAAHHNREKMVQILIDAIGNKNVKKHGHNALLCASERGHVNIMKLLLNNGVDIDKSCSNSIYTQERSSLFGAIEHNKIESVIVLLTYHANVNTFDISKRTPLICAVYKNNPHILTLLLNYGADIEQAGPGGTPLIYACKDDNMNMVNILLKAEANPNAKDSLGNTPLMVVSKSSESHKLTSLLIQYGAELNDTLTDGTSVLYHALKKDIISMARSHNQEITSCDFRDKSTQLLIENGVKIDINCLDLIKYFLNESTLSVNSKNYCVNMLIYILLINGIDIDDLPSKDGYGDILNTVLDYQNNEIDLDNSWLCQAAMINKLYHLSIRKNDMTKQEHEINLTDAVDLVHNNTFLQSIIFKTFTNQFQAAEHFHGSLDSFFKTSSISEEQAMSIIQDVTVPLFIRKYVIFNNLQWVEKYNTSLVLNIDLLQNAEKYVSIKYLQFIKLQDDITNDNFIEMLHDPIIRQSKHVYKMITSSIAKSNGDLCDFNACYTKFLKDEDFYTDVKKYFGKKDELHYLKQYLDDILQTSDDESFSMVHPLIEMYSELPYLYQINDTPWIDDGTH